MVGARTAAPPAATTTMSYTIEEQRDIEQALSVLPRTIRPLPKRQRVVRQAAPSDSPIESEQIRRSAAMPDEQALREADEDEPYVAVSRKGQAARFGQTEREGEEQNDTTTAAKDYYDRANERIEPTNEYRPIDRRDHHHHAPDSVDASTPSAALPRHESISVIAESHEDESTTRTTNSIDATLSSPPTSPPASEPLQYDQDKSAHGPDYFPVFGQQGDDIKRALGRASIFSKAGLFGALGLAALHPTLEHAGAPSEDEGEDGGVGHDDDHHDRHHGYDDDYGHDLDRSLSTSIPLGGSNKKKRKIPGIHRSSNRLDDEDDPYGEEADDGRHAARQTNDADDRPIIVPKVPADTPKTAKAALAKLALPPVHVSISTLTSSYRRHRRKRFRFNEKLLAPLKLSPLSTVHIPQSYMKEPPVSPASTGLKGSRAVKAAQKLQKEREREKQRIRAAIGADNLKLPNLFDPKGLKKRRASPTELTLPDSLQLSDPPDLGDVERELERFSFIEPPSECIFVRWTALVDQVQHLRLAKERAAKAREEERERRLEKEKEQQAAAAAATAAPAPATASNAAPSATSKAPAVPPAKSTGRTSAATASAAQTPPATTPAPANKKGTSKKGKKKRSAYANANNVHHRINYVPSRMPSSAAGGVGGGGASSDTPHNVTHKGDGLPYSWPASDEAIAAAANPDGTLPRLIGDDEWICAFCDYELFFGEPTLLERAIRRRKKVLRVRAKAKERAAKLGAEVAGGAAAGAAAASSSAVNSTTAAAGKPKTDAASSGSTAA